MKPVGAFAVAVQRGLGAWFGRSDPVPVLPPAVLPDAPLDPATLPRRNGQDLSFHGAGRATSAVMLGVLGVVGVSTLLGAPPSDAATLVGAGLVGDGAALSDAGLTFELISRPGVSRAVANALVDAVQTPRSGGDNGIDGVLTAHGARAAADVWTTATDATRTRLSALLDDATQVAERSLILGAVVPRGAALTSSEPEQALAQIEAFAGAIRGMPRAELMQMTTLIDIDETHDSVADTPFTNTVDGKTDDGLFQRYVSSCGPTSIEVLLGNLDPIYAFDVRTAGIATNPEMKDDFQRAVLVKYGENVRSRIVPAYQAEARGALTGLRAEGVLSATQTADLQGYLLNRAKPTAGTKAALTTMRAHVDGFPSAEVVRTLRDYEPVDPSKTYGRIGWQNVGRVLNDVVGEAAGVQYEQVSLYDTADATDTGAFVAANGARLQAAIESGPGVLFKTLQPAHFWTLNGVKSEGETRSFQVHDTWTGKTAWVTEAALGDGSFAEAFPPGGGKGVTTLDLFYLPAQAE